MSLRIAIFGQAPFGKDVTTRLLDDGHEVVGVHVPPDAGGRADPLAAEAEARGLPLFRHRRFRRKGEALPELVEEYLALGADLNVMPFTTVILPPEIVDAPRLGSLCFHPSLLPAYRGGTAIPWQIILGASVSGVTVFQPDEGLDTGPIVVQKGGVEIGPAETAASLYFDHLYPLGLEAMAEAVAAVAAGTAKPLAQTEEGVSFQPRLDDEAARIDWARPAQEIDRLIRGCDPQPGAHALRGDEPVRLFGGGLREAASGAAPGTIMAADGDTLLVAASGGAIAIKKARLGDAKKAPATVSGLEVGDRLS
ncbi:MAG: methionyl-tRNA formyltransferase [Deltaproteobacteria bacterium]|nr:methionyl-tRNA formyltransferase [Deltaproteobacteria bacterium]MBW2446268.1 methionyl-tRNA formyltransferase [Deltaproteobacteria bacterium]